MTIEALVWIGFAVGFISGGMLGYAIRASRVDPEVKSLEISIHEARRDLLSSLAMAKAIAQGDNSAAVKISNEMTKDIESR